VSGSPEYSIQLRDWKTGGDAAKADFVFKNAGNASKVEVKDVREKFSDLPSNFTIGTIGAQNEHDKASRTVHRHRACRSLRA
jgi:hypothetical protein